MRQPLPGISCPIDLSKLASAPAETGGLRTIVRRPGVGERELLLEAELDPEEGLLGDRWIGRHRRYPGRYTHSQVSMMRADVVECLAARAGVEPWVSGDNLLVDLDLAEDNLPVGSLLGIGAARLRVTPKRHTPCTKFRERFGVEAVRALKTLSRARGLFLRVEVGGTIRVGDPVQLLERGVVTRRVLPG